MCCVARNAQSPEMMTLEKRSPAIEDVRSYWEANPLYSYEVAEPGSPDFFARFDEIKRRDVERFATDIVRAFSGEGASPSDLRIILEDR